MKVYVRGEIIDTRKEPVVILFDNDLDRVNHSENISNMIPKEGIRCYLAFPDSMSADEAKFILNEAKTKAEK